MITLMNGNGLSLVGTNKFYRELRLKSLLDHEIGTHHVRMVNQWNLKPNIKGNRVGWW